MGNSRKLLPLLYKYIKIFNKRKMVRFMQNEIVYGIKKYILGGRAKFSIIQISNGTTIKEDYEVRTSQNNRNMYFLYTRELGNGKMSYHGYISNYNDQILFHKPKTFKLNRFEDFNNRAVSGLLWVLNHREPLGRSVHVVHNGYCSKCGRPIRDDMGIKTGFCDKCRERQSKE